jgi:hypothetical protein
MRNIWRTADVKRIRRVVEREEEEEKESNNNNSSSSNSKRGGRTGLVTIPKKLASNAIQKLLSRALSEQASGPIPLLSNFFNIKKIDAIKKRSRVHRQRILRLSKYKD